MNTDARVTSGAARLVTDVVIIGDGVIGLSTALEMARAGLTCQIVGARNPGAASLAAAGLLAPTIGQLSENVRQFFVASYDLYPEYLARLQEFDPGLSLLEGLIEVASVAPHGPAAATTRTLSPAELSALEPALWAPLGGLLHTRNGAIDNVRLVRALRHAVKAESRVSVLEDSSAAIEATPGRVAVRRANGDRIDARFVVVAAGAWSPQLTGLPRPIPVSPLKGQMIALGSVPLTRPVMADDVYLVPRKHETAVGATVEQAGFDIRTTTEAVARLREAAIKICPTLRQAAVLRAWAGTRPATPDMLPIIGPDPDSPRLLYACGHSKNGILLAPITARVLTALAHERRPEFDVAPFAIVRFENGRIS